MSAPPPDNGSTDHASGDSLEPPDRARSGRGLVIVIVAVVIGVLLLPSATRAPLLAGASTATSTTTAAGGTSKHHHTASSTSTTVLPSTIHVLVANATTTNGVAGRVTAYLGSKGFAVLTATNASVKVTASQIYTVGGATADTNAVAAALSLPAASIEPAASQAPVPSTTGANVVVVVGPDLATRFPAGASTSAPAG